MIRRRSISPDKRDIFISISLTEGPKYTVSDIKIAGELLIPEEEIRKLIKVKCGEVFSRTRIAESTKNINDRLGNDGYAFANVNAAPELDKVKHQASFTFLAKSKVAVVQARPETVLRDIERVMKEAGFEEALPKNKGTIVKDNISWHFPMPSANTTPWQLEGTVQALQRSGFNDLVCVQNKTVVIDTYKGEDLNGYVPIFKHYQIPVKYNFKPEDMKWIPFQPKGELLVLNEIFREGLHIPDFFEGKNVVHLPTMKCHLYTTTTGAMKNAFGGLLNTHRHYTHTWIHETLVDLLTLLIQANDPLAVWSSKAQVEAKGRLFVLLPVTRLRQIAIRPRRTRVYAGTIPSRAGGPGTEFFGVREYRPGDPPHSINWRASARFTETLYANEYQQERVADVGIIVDGRLKTNEFAGGHSLFDHSVLGAASIADALLNQGNRVGLLLYSTYLGWTVPGYGKIQRERILHALANASVVDIKLRRNDFRRQIIIRLEGERR